MSAMAVGAAFALAAVGAAASPYLARLTHSVPDKDNSRWWTGVPVGLRRVIVTAGVAAVLGLLAGATAGFTPLLPAYTGLVLAGAPLVVIDYEVQRLPNRLTYALAGAEAVLLTVAAAADGSWSSWLRAVEGAAAVYAVLFVPAFVSPRSFGLGDVKLGGILGGYLGWFGWRYVYWGIFGGFVLGTVVALVLLAARRVGMKTAIPFGPMLIAGALVVLAFDLAPSFV